MRWLALLAVMFALVGTTGCGGGSNEAATTTETTTTETTTTETGTSESASTTEETSTDTSASASGSFNWTSKDCQNLVKGYLGLSAAVAAASSGQDVSSDIQQFSKYVDEVPSEIRADVKTLAAAYSEYATKIKDLGFTPGQVPTADQLQQLQEASSSLGDQNVQAAGKRLSAWTTKNCT